MKIEQLKGICDMDSNELVHLGKPMLKSIYDKLLEEFENTKSNEMKDYLEEALTKIEIALENEYI